MKTVKILIYAIFFAAGSLSFAGGFDSGGGGGAFVCRDKQGAVISATLLDWWEAQHIAQLSLVLRSDEFHVQAQNKIDQIKALDLNFGSLIENNYVHMLPNITFADPDVQILPPADADPHYQKLNCPLEGMMYYDGVYDRLVINQELFDKLGVLGLQTEMAAALLHEAIYKTLRELPTPQTTSTQTRKLVGRLFSEMALLQVDFHEAQTKIPNQDEVFLCQGIDTLVRPVEFYVFGAKPLNTDGKSDAQLMVTKAAGNEYRAGILAALGPQGADGLFHVDLDLKSIFWSDIDGPFWHLQTQLSLDPQKKSEGDLISLDKETLSPIHFNVNCSSLKASGL